MTDHHDFGDHHDYQHHDDYYPDPAPHDDPLAYEPPAYHHGYEHDDTPPAAEHHLPDEHHEPTHEPAPTTHDLHIVDDQPPPHDTAGDDYHDPTDLFPPPVDVGDLPEPVDGYPWIDPATLGTGDLPGHHTDQPPVPAHELAEYAGTDLPAGTDPWTVLAASDDPATNTLARFWHDTTT